MATNDMATRPVPFLEFAGLAEGAKATISVQVPAQKVETFGFLLGREMSAIGSGHSERAGEPEHFDDRWLAATSPKGWVAVVGVESVRPRRGLGRLTVRILGPDTPDYASVHLAQVVAAVKRAEVEAKTALGYQYAWGATVGPLGQLQALDERARHRFSGVYEWSDVTLTPLVHPYEGEARLSDGVSGPYRLHRAWATGSVTAQTWELAQRLADRKALEVSLLLSLMLRTAIEPAQAAASVAQGDASDLDRLFPHELVSSPGTYAPHEQAFRQDYGPTAPRDRPHPYVLPNDAPDLWRNASALNGGSPGLWDALAAYRTGCSLRFEFPSLAFVALVSAAEALVDTATIPKCCLCHQYKGVGKSFRRVLAPEGAGTDEDKFAGSAYNTRSRIVHDARLFGGEMASRVGRAGAWAPDPTASFLYAEWPELERLVARALLAAIRSLT